ncbi:MAG: hypothetical protein OJJ21_03195 [Ferrovibrio sp.]|uniref:cupin domain-containing protein n=1 Tax=Ferrovibrio sp. TaxID=1917215 RepID=UPI0026398879|nr:hypothetical protein [Ferrovibrio sp.]MCW0232584.1 hypothetical protein [Ferrovibrio sp.]
MNLQILIPRIRDGVAIVQKSELRWVESARPGQRLAAVYGDEVTGRFLGMVEFDAMATTGLHQHLDVAHSYFLDGGLTDYQGSVQTGDYGLNLAGATHEAIAYRRTLTASRLDGSVLFDDDSTRAPTVHTGAMRGKIQVANSDILPDRNINLDSLPWETTGQKLVRRRLIFDYFLTPHNRRAVCLQLLPGAQIHPFLCKGMVDIFVIGGAVLINQNLVSVGGFAVLAPEAVLQISTSYGALLIAWADGPSQWLESEEPDLFGF